MHPCCPPPKEPDQRAPVARRAGTMRATPLPCGWALYISRCYTLRCRPLQKNIEECRRRPFIRPSTTFPPCRPQAPTRRFLGCVRSSAPTSPRSPQPSCQPVNFCPTKAIPLKTIARILPQRRCFVVLAPVPLPTPAYYPAIPSGRVDFSSGLHAT